MAITKIGDTEIYDGTAADVVLTKPTGVAEDDILIVTISCDDASDPDFTTPGGWTLLFHQEVTSGGDHEVTCFYKVAGASEPSSYTFTATGNTEQKIGMIRAYRGVDTTTPISDWDVGQESTSTTLYTPSVDVADNGSKLVVGWGTGTYTLITYYSSLSGTLENIDLSNSASTYRGQITADEDEDSGSSIQRQWNGTSSPSEDVSSWAIVLKPAGGAAGDIDEVQSVDWDNISSVNSIAKASIDEINTLSAS